MFFRRCLFLLIFAVLGVFGTIFFLRQTTETSTRTTAETARGVSSIGLFADLLGLRAPRTYLLLFQNNTELRPSGGFIGSYAVVRMNRMKPEVLVVSGSETLDREADPMLLPPAPLPLVRYLGVERWYFRDSNWSPDFAISAKTALERYRTEGGSHADEIDVVIAITPTVMEALLERTGSVVVEDMLFSHDTVTEKLEYEVEYGYAERGIAFPDRKDILRPLMTELLGRVREDLLLHLSDYTKLFERLVRERHILLFSVDDQFMRALAAAGAAGRLVTPQGDYLLWADANLGALKTDHAMERALSYEVERSGDMFTATATMRYNHRGVFDWRTTRYRTFARIYVPDGAELIGTFIDEKPLDGQDVSTGTELGKRWFGAFLSMEPGTEKRMSFSYRLPAIPEPYTLFVQKQSGTIAHQLTVSMNFDNNTKTFTGDLREDQTYVYQKSGN